LAGEHLVLYDGVCGLCNALVQFLLPRDRRRLFDYASLQSATGRSWLSRFGKVPDDLDTFAVVTNYRRDSPAILIKAQGALFVASMLGQPWRSATMLRIFPWALLNAGYDLIARYRYRIFGRSDVCVPPPATERERFIDV
jgi:predicted DCC family thiol-disulfide oxidoreductase YuxK